MADNELMISQGGVSTCGLWNNGSKMRKKVKAFSRKKWR